MSVREKRIEQALELYANGCNATEIGRKLHVNHSTVIEWLKERGVYRQVFLTEEQLDAIRMYYITERLSIKEIAEIMGLTEHKVHNAIQYHNIRRSTITEEEKEERREADRKEKELFARVTVKGVDDPVYYVPRKFTNEQVIYNGKKYRDVSGFYLGG